MTNAQTPRQARPEDRAAMLDLIDLVHRAGKGRSGSMADDYPLLFAPENLCNSYIITSGLRVVASSSIWINQVFLGGVTLRVGGIGSVATLPELRKHGLGAAVMEACHQRMFELGCQVGLLGTAISNWYRRLGWENASRQHSYSFNRANIALLPGLPGSVVMHDVGPGGDAPAEIMQEVVRLREMDRLGAVRSVEQTRALIRARGNGNLILASWGDSVRAYLLARQRKIIEWGGPADVVAGLLRAFYEASDDLAASTSTRDEKFRPILQEEMTVVTPASGHPLVCLLEELGIPRSVHYLGMVYIFDPERILDAYNICDITASGQGPDFTLTRGGDSITLDRNGLGKLFFGPEKVAGFASDLFPLPLWQWQLDRV